MTLPLDAKTWAHAERRLAELAAAEQRMLHTEHAITDYVNELYSLGDERQHIRIIQKIRPGIGTMEVDGDGRLLHLSLDHRALLVSDHNALGRRILEALAAARAEATAQYKQEAARIARRNRV